MKMITNIKFLLFIVLCLSCSANDKYKPTPARYKSIVKVSKSDYSRDSNQVYNSVKKMIYSHLDPFFSKTDYDQQSQLFIDSLIYGPDKLKMVVLIILKNNTDKLLTKENTEKFYYNAYYLFCSRDNLNTPIKVYDRSSFGLLNFYSYSEIRQELHEYCFLRLFKESKPNLIHYNIDDIRFWRSTDFNWVLKNSTATSGTLNE